MIDQAKIQSLFKPQFVNEVFQKMCETSFALKHGTRLPNMTGKTMDMDILSNLPMAYWVGQDTEKRKTTSLALQGKRIYAEELSVILPISRNSLMDANVDLEKLIKERLIEAGATKIDQAIITGVGKPRNFREGIIPSCVNHSATVSRATYTDLYSACDEAMRLVEESDYEVSAFAGGLGVKSKFRNLVDKNGRLLTNNEITDMPKLYLKNGAWDKNIAELLVGDFKQIYFAMRQEMECRVLDQATIVDPDTNTTYYLAQQNMVAFMINMRMGWEIPNPISRETFENNPNYFPFAVVTPAGATLPNNYDVVKYGTVIVNVPITGQAPANDMDKLIDGTITSFALPTGVTKIAAYKFYQHTSLVTLLLTGLTNIGNYAFYGCTGIKEVSIPSTLTTVGTYIFYGCTGLKTIVVNNTTLAQYQFQNTNNVDNLTLNKNIKTIPSYCFAYCGQNGSGFELVFDTAEVTLNQYCFQYSGVKKLQGLIKTSSTYAFYNCAKVTGLNCSVIVSDSNDRVYNEGDAVVLGTRLDLVFQPAEGQEVPYQIKINGVAIDLTNFNNTYTGIFFEDNLSIVAIYWDGVQMPYNPTFADNDWSLIALGIKSRVGFDIGWKIGDTKTVTTTDGKTYTLRIADITADRYAYADGGGNSQAVIEFVEGLPTTMTINDSVKEGYYAGGGWALCDMNNIKLPNFLATLPSELQEAISEVALTGYSYTSPSPRTGNSKLFLANEYEIWGKKYNSNAVEATTQFQLYAEKGAAAMKKYRLGSTSSEWFWTRSPYSGGSNYFCVWQGASYGTNGAYYGYGVAPVFAI